MKKNIALLSTTLFVLSTKVTYAGTVWGPPIPKPPGVENYNSLTDLLSNLFRLIIVGAGIFALFNFALAGYDFLSAGDDPKKVQNAWRKIYQSIIGLAVSVSSILIAAIIGEILFDNYLQLLTITVYGPS